MRNKKQFTEYEIRNELSNQVYAMFGDAIVLTTKYDQSGAFIYAVYADGIREYAYITYKSVVADLENHRQSLAMRIIGEIPSEEILLPDSINYANY